jgi:hypothetical protein
MKNHWILWKQLNDLAIKHELNQGIWPKDFELTLKKAFPDEQVGYSRSYAYGKPNKFLKIILTIYLVPITDVFSSIINLTEANNQKVNWEWSSK